MFRLLSLLLLVVALAGFSAHILWAMQAGEGAAIQRGGALLIAVGVALAALPYLRVPFREQVVSRLPHDYRTFLLSEEMSDQMDRHIEEARAKAPLDIIVERYIAFALILGGTILNGYGDLFGRWLGIVP